VEFFFYDRYWGNFSKIKKTPPTHFFLDNRWGHISTFKKMNLLGHRRGVSYFNVEK
jgi:hypothetical protein